MVDLIASPTILLDGLDIYDLNQHVECAIFPQWKDSVPVMEMALAGSQRSLKHNLLVAQHLEHSDK